jgi:hypothetical protein
MSPSPSPSSETAVEKRFTEAGVPLAAVALADQISSSTTAMRVDPQICLWADVVAVYVSSAMITEILDEGHEAFTDGVDFASIASLLRDAADKYEAIGKRLAN